MTADRRIGPIGQVRAIPAQLRIQRLAHAVQALELESAFAIGKFENGRDRQRVVGCELREEAGPQRQ